MTDNAIAPVNVAADIERVLVGGDLAKLTPEQRVSYVGAVCRSVGLNPLTRPFEFISLGGKLVLYAKRDATDQLRALRGVSITIASREVLDDVLVVTARATMPDGRQDESVGAVAVAGLKGEARANAMMKAETKAKRRVTLSACGLGMLDESEAESIPSARIEPVMATVVEPATNRAEELNGWGEAIAAADGQPELDEVRTKMREHFGAKVPRSLAEMWRARLAAVTAAA